MNMKQTSSMSGLPQCIGSTPIEDVATTAAAETRPVGTKKAVDRKTKLSLQKAATSKKRSDSARKCWNLAPVFRLDEMNNLNDSLDFQDSVLGRPWKKSLYHKPCNHTKLKMLDCVVNDGPHNAPQIKGLECGLNTDQNPPTVDVFHGPTDVEQVSLSSLSEATKYFENRHALVVLEKCDRILDMFGNQVTTRPEGFSESDRNKDFKSDAELCAEVDIRRDVNSLLKAYPELEKTRKRDTADVFKVNENDTIVLEEDGRSGMYSADVSEDDAIVLEETSRSGMYSADGVSYVESKDHVESPATNCKDMQGGDEEAGKNCLEVTLSTSFHTCPTCGSLFPRGSFVRHMRACLEKELGCKQTTLSKGGTGDKKQIVTDGYGALGAEYVFCPLCQKDITHLNSHRRTVHTNKCFDEQVQRKQEEERHKQALEVARTLVLGCPMCGKVLRTQQSRKSHLKRCSGKLGVSMEQLLLLIKKQEDEHQANLAAGILANHRPAGKKKTSSLDHGAQKIKSPKSKQEEDTHLALALSSSLQPDWTAATSNPRLGRKKRKLELDRDQYLLCTVTKSQTTRRIADRVSHLLSQEKTEEEIFVKLPTVDTKHLQHLFIKKLILLSEATEGAQLSLWKAASLVDKKGERDKSPHDRFYVPELMPPVEVTTVVPGSKLRSMSQIPGRRRSSGFSSCEKKDKTTEEQGAGNLSLTQTAILLAEMAAEAEAEAESNSQNSLFPVDCFVEGDEEYENLSREDLISDMRSLVDQPTYSDAKIVVSGGQEIHVHCLILSVRCPQILELMQKGSGRADLSAWSADAVLALLRFVYAGLTDVEDRLLVDTLNLAERLGVHRLADVCQRRLWKSQHFNLGNDFRDPGFVPNEAVGCIVESVRTEHQLENKGIIGLQTCTVGATSFVEHTAGGQNHLAFKDRTSTGADNISHRWSETNLGGGPNVFRECNYSFEHNDTVQRAVRIVHKGDSRVGKADTTLQREQQSDRTSSEPNKACRIPAANTEDLTYIADNNVFGDERFPVSHHKCNIRERNTFIRNDRTPFEEVRNSSIHHRSCIRENPVTLRHIPASFREDGPPIRENRAIHQAMHRAMHQDTHRAVHQDKEPAVKEERTGLGEYRVLIEDGNTCTQDRTAVTGGRTRLEQDKTPVREDRTRATQDKTPVREDRTRATWVRTPVGKDRPRTTQVKTPVREDRISLRQDKTRDRELKSPAENFLIPQKHNKTSCNDPVVSHTGEMDSYITHTVMTQNMKEKIMQCFVQKEFSNDTLDEECHSSSDDNDVQFLTMEENRFKEHRTACSHEVRLKCDSTPPGHETPGRPESQDVESIEISDDDLFGPSASDTSFPNTPQKSSLVPNMPQGSVGETSLRAEGSLAVHVGICVSSKNKRVPHSSGARRAEIADLPAQGGSEKRHYSSDDWLAENEDQRVESTDSSKFSHLLKRRRTSENYSYSECAVDSKAVKENVYQPSNLLKNHSKKACDADCASPVDSEKLRIGWTPQDSKRPSAAWTSKEDIMRVASDVLLCEEGAEFLNEDGGRPAFRREEASMFLHKRGAACQHSDRTTLPCSVMPSLWEDSRAVGSWQEANRLIARSCDCASSRILGTKAQPCSADACTLPQVRRCTHCHCSLSPLGVGVIATTCVSCSKNVSSVRRKLADDIDSVGVQEAVQNNSDLDLEIVDDSPGEVSSPKFHLSSGQPSTQRSGQPSTQRSGNPSFQKSGRPEPYHQLHQSALVPHSSVLESSSSVWDGYDDVEIYNPDLDVMNTDLSPIVTVSNSAENQRREKTDAPAEMQFSPVNKTDSLSDIPQSPSLPRPVRTNKASLHDVISMPACGSPAFALSKQKLVAGATHCVTSADSPVGTSCSLSASSPGSLPDLAPSGGGYVTDADIAAFNSSYLWAEENAPEVFISENVSATAQDLWESGNVQPCPALSAETPTPRRAKTPSPTAHARKKGRVWVPPSPFTPMPDYDQMNTPQLKEEVRKYGVRPLGKKKMRCLLKDIYENTHQYETDPEFEEAGLQHESHAQTEELGSRSPPLHNKSNSHETRALATSGRQRGRQPSKGKAKSRRKIEGQLQTLPEIAEEVAVSRNKESAGKNALSTGVSGKGCMLEDDRRQRAWSECSSSSEKNSFSSQSSQESDHQDMSVLEVADQDEEDDWGLSQQVSTVDIQQQIADYILGRPELYEQVLTYEPLDLAILIADLRAAGMRWGQQKLMDFLNSKCITFTTKNLGCRQRKHQVKRNKKSAARKFHKTNPQ